MDKDLKEAESEVVKLENEYAEIERQLKHQRAILLVAENRAEKIRRQLWEDGKL